VAGLYRTVEEKRATEARNGAIQFLKVIHEIENWRAGESSITPALLLELQRLAINQIYTCAGTLRTGPVYIQGSKHQPPEHHLIPGLVDEMCGYVNRSWGDKTPIHLAAYLMWRVNWIHPFFGGNGRTARALSYLVLCAKLGFRLPGEKTIPDLIVEKRNPYFDALQSADVAWETGALNLEGMETLMESLLSDQLLGVYVNAGGRLPKNPN
jgi:Fic family protein